jgi:signal peptidase I
MVLYIKAFFISTVILFLYYTNIELSNGSNTGSMKPTIKDGSILVEWKHAYIFTKPQVGDIVSFDKSFLNETKTYAKRIIAIPGDILKVKNHLLWIKVGDGFKELKLPTLPLAKDAASTSLVSEVIKDYDIERIIELKEGEYWVVGDNYLNSFDSKYFGKVYLEEIDGKILFSF